MRILPLFLLCLCSCVGGQLDPKAQRAVDTFECYVAVLAPYVGEVCDTADLVRDVVQGKVDVRRTLLLLGVKAPEVVAIFEQLQACLPSDPEPQAPAGVIQASL